ncbi:unnamed protein product [Ilex paraguariensis]|uniref:Uncharacterized protein n=1 Tax=Ilex paraguariensis TaxID=185542 RepID=A0ABC8TF12_9AQUA
MEHETLPQGIKDQTRAICQVSSNKPLLRTTCNPPQGSESPIANPLPSRGVPTNSQGISKNSQRKNLNSTNLVEPGNNGDPPSFVGTFSILEDPKVGAFIRLPFDPRLNIAVPNPWDDINPNSLGYFVTEPLESPVDGKAHYEYRDQDSLIVLGQNPLEAHSLVIQVEPFMNMNQNKEDEGELT